MVNKDSNHDRKDNIRVRRAGIRTVITTTDLDFNREVRVDPVAVPAVVVVRALKAGLRILLRQKRRQSRLRLPS